MNFCGSLRFQGNILQRAKKGAAGEVELVFNGGGEESILIFTNECIRPLYSALAKLMSEGGLYENLKPGDHGRGQIVPEFVFVNLEDDKVSFKGDLATDMKDLPLPLLRISSADKESALEFAFNEKQAQELSNRIQEVVKARQSIRAAVQEKAL